MVIAYVRGIPQRGQTHRHSTHTFRSNSRAFFHVAFGMWTFYMLMSAYRFDLI